MTARLVGLLALLCLALPAQAAENGPSDNMLSMYAMLGASAGRQDINYGVIKSNGYGAGFGVMGGFVLPVTSLSGGDLGIGGYVGIDGMGGAEHTSADSDTGVWMNFRFEGGFQVNVPLKWQALRTSIRAGGLMLGDSAAGGVYGKSLKVRVDWRHYSAEIGAATGGANAQSLTLRWRETFLKCFGFGLERLSVPDRQSDGIHARLFYAVDI